MGTMVVPEHGNYGGAGAWRLCWCRSRDTAFAGVRSLARQET
ncbi:hypothetical protein [Desulfomarina sp.]